MRKIRHCRLKGRRAAMTADRRGHVFCYPLSPPHSVNEYAVYSGLGVRNRGKMVKTSRLLPESRKQRGWRFCFRLLAGFFRFSLPPIFHGIPLSVAGAKPRCIFSFQQLLILKGLRNRPSQVLENKGLFLQVLEINGLQFLVSACGRCFAGILRSHVSWDASGSTLDWPWIGPEFEPGFSRRCSAISNQTRPVGSR